MHIINGRLLFSQETLLAIIMKHARIILTLSSLLLLALSSLAQSRIIRVEWENPNNSNIAGFRLYLGNNPVCETNDPLAKTMDCTLDVPDGEAQFALTSYLTDGSESAPSTPYVFIFSSSLKAVLSANTLEGSSPLPVTFDATQSTGSIVLYEWMFGDGESGSGSIASHTFSNAGSYTVTLKVTDESGALDQDTATVTVSDPSAANTPPIAIVSSSATVGTAPLQVKFDGTASRDSDGTIVSHKWDMGDGGTASGAKINYTYSAPGTFTATLTVTDDGGLTDSTSTPVLVSDPPPGSLNRLPVAAISASSNRGLVPFTLHLSAQGSYDPDGKIKKYSWNFGDGTGASGPAVQHTYSLPGIYLITLQVIDNMGAKSYLATFTFSAMDKNSKLLPSLPYILNLLLNRSTTQNDALREKAENDSKTGANE